MFLSRAPNHSPSNALEEVAQRSLPKWATDDYDCKAAATARGVVRGSTKIQ